MYLFVKFHEHNNLVLNRAKQVVLMDQVKHIAMSKSVNKDSLHMCINYWRKIFYFSRK